ncbi:DNA (Cytosine-5)-methyltransferase DRM1/2 isoform 2 [Hibiscus syriacus]|uniref:DNA (Cytosine-5)-methyltransferase DRM1/2 isoform 2 n=1 Tax=Hibiscus syriacus TaxID=106335 RepID=A0A6A3CJC9_HIBSY|nr:DNA (Cytosine-5)-methyltransferase DRM1/2 isoform 2 [Hibiscus syriacus]
MQHVDCDNYSSDYETIFQDGFTDIDSSSDTEEILNSDSDKENKLLCLTKMGYSDAEVSIAMERCGPDSSITELTDFICAAQMAKAADILFPVKDRKPLCNDPNYKQRRNSSFDFLKRKKQRKLEKKLLNEDNHAVHLLNPMIGFGVSTEPDQITQRTLPEDVIGPPHFYYENVALALFGVWTEMSRYLYNVEPEFVDSKYFCDAARKKGYIHNLPIENRFPLIMLPPRTIHDVFLLTKKIVAFLASKNKIELSTNMYRKCQIDRDDLNKVAPLEPDEVKMLLSFPKNHTRGKGSTRDMFPSGINVLSFFSGISDAEVTFYCLGISLKCARTECDCLFCCSKILIAISHSLFLNHGKVQQSSEGHNEDNPDKENDRHGRSSNGVSRLEPS